MHMTPPVGMGCLYQWIGVSADQLPPPPQQPTDAVDQPFAPQLPVDPDAPPTPLLPDGKLTEANLHEAWEHAATLCAETHKTPHENVGYGPVTNRIAEYITKVCAAFPRTREHHVTILIGTGGGNGASDRSAKITRAWYGEFAYSDSSRGTDATAKIKALVAKGEHTIKADNSVFGDPSPGKPKHLWVEYRSNRGTRSVSVKEGEACILDLGSGSGLGVDRAEGWHDELKDHIDALAARRVFVQTAVLAVEGDVDSGGDGCNGVDVFAISGLTFDPTLRLVEHVRSSTTADTAAAAAAPDAATSNVELSATTNTNAIETVEEALGRLTHRFAEAACYWLMRVSIDREGLQTLDCHVTASATRQKEFGFGSAMSGFDEEDPMVLTAKGCFRDVLGTAAAAASAVNDGGDSDATRSGEVALTAFEHVGVMASGDGGGSQSGLVPASNISWSFGSMLQPRGNKALTHHSQSNVAASSTVIEDRRCFAAHHDLFRTYVRACTADWADGKTLPKPSVKQPNALTAADATATADSNSNAAEGTEGAPPKAVDGEEPAADAAAAAAHIDEAASVEVLPEKGSLGDKVQILLNYLSDLESRPYVLHHKATDMKTGLTQFGYVLAQLHGASTLLAQCADQWCQSERLRSSAGARMLMLLGRSADKELDDSNFEYERQRHEDVEKQRNLWEARPAKGEHKKVGSSGVGRAQNHDYKENKTPDFAFRIEMFSGLQGESTDGAAPNPAAAAAAGATPGGATGSTGVDISQLKEREIRAYLKEHQLDQGGKTVDKRQRLVDFVAKGGVLKPAGGKSEEAAKDSLFPMREDAGSGGTLAPPRERKEEREARKAQEQEDLTALQAADKAANTFEDEMEEWGFGATPQPQQWLRAKSNVKLSDVSEHHPIIQSARLEQARAEAIAAERAVAQKEVAEQRAAEEAVRREEAAAAIEYAETLEKARLAAEVEVAEKKKAKKSLVLSRWGREEQVDAVAFQSHSGGRRADGSSNAKGHRRTRSVAPPPQQAPSMAAKESTPSKSGKAILEIMQTLATTADCGGCKVGDKVEVMNRFPDGSILVRNVKKVWEVRQHKSKLLPAHAFTERPPTPEVEFASFGSTSPVGQLQPNSSTQQPEAGWWSKHTEEKRRAADTTTLQPHGNASPVVDRVGSKAQGTWGSALADEAAARTPSPLPVASPVSSPLQPDAVSTRTAPPASTAPQGLRGKELMEFNIAESERIAAAEGREMTQAEKHGVGSASEEDTKRRLDTMTFDFSFGGN